MKYRLLIYVRRYCICECIDNIVSSYLLQEYAVGFHSVYKRISHGTELWTWQAALATPWRWTWWTSSATAPSKVWFILELRKLILKCFRIPYEKSKLQKIMNLSFNTIALKSSPSFTLNMYVAFAIQIKICAEYRDMLPRPRLVCQEPGLRPIDRSPGVPDKSSRVWEYFPSSLVLK